MGIKPSMSPCLPLRIDSCVHTRRPFGTDMSTKLNKSDKLGFIQACALFWHCLSIITNSCHSESFLVVYTYDAFIQGRKQVRQEGSLLSIKKDLKSCHPTAKCVLSRIFTGWNCNSQWRRTESSLIWLNLRRAHLSIIWVTPNQFMCTFHLSGWPKEEKQVRPRWTGALSFCHVILDWLLSSRAKNSIMWWGVGFIYLSHRVHSYAFSLCHNGRSLDYPSIALALAFLGPLIPHNLP